MAAFGRHKRQRNTHSWRQWYGGTGMGGGNEGVEDRGSDSDNDDFLTTPQNVSVALVAS